jgi:biotin-[acetyl-CoA-carboxylase] ligase BirA-like protein
LRAAAAGPGAAASLPETTRNLWAALSDRCDLWVSAGAETPVAVIGQAPRSQFAALLDALKEGYALPDGAAALALRGHQFKGQRERAWSALEGNLHLCVYYRPGVDVGRVGAALTAVPAVAVVQTIRELYGESVDAGIKWVNDVLVHGRKVSGVLTGTQARDRTIEHVVFGVGINVAATPVLEPTPFVPEAGCLRDLTGRQGVGLWDVLVPLLRRIDEGYRHLLENGPVAALDAYRSYSCVLGRRVRVWDASTDTLSDAEPIASGVVEAIELDLSLRIAGCAEPVSSGRLALDE